MPTRRTSTHALRSAIDCLPRSTREAMLAGVQANDIIVGAYVDSGGGICPMLAAHRQGSRIDFLPFARAWDGFTEARRARRATEREVAVLTSHLQSSLLADEEAGVDLGAAIAEHNALRARGVAERAAEPRRSRRPSRRSAPVEVARRRRSRHPRPGDPDRSRELRHRPGWSWLRPFRRVEELDEAVAAAAAAQHAESRRDTASPAQDAERQLAGLAS